MQYFAENFDPVDYEGITDFGGNKNVTLMINRESGRIVVRKTIGGMSAELYKCLVYLRHTNIVQIMGIEPIFESSTVTEQVGASRYYTYEEYIAGKTLSDILNDDPIPEETALNWMKQLCSALKTLHGQDPTIIHRDIKPGNVMLSPDGVIKLIDFDAAKEYSPDKDRDTELIGTPGYASPEQYGFAPSGPQTDIYALGVLFHELLTGHKPNEGNGLYRGKYKSALQSCLEFDPNKRCRSIKALEGKLGVRGFLRFTLKAKSKPEKVFAAVLHSLTWLFVFAMFMQVYFVQTEPNPGAAPAYIENTWQADPVKRYLGTDNYSIGSRRAGQGYSTHLLNLYGHRIDVDDLIWTGHHGGVTGQEGQAFIRINDDGSGGIHIDIGPNPERGDRRYHDIILSEFDIDFLAAIRPELQVDPIRRHLGVRNYSIGPQLTAYWGSWFPLNLHGAEINADDFASRGNFTRSGITDREGQAIIVAFNNGDWQLKIDIGPNPEYGDRLHHYIRLNERDIAALANTKPELQIDPVRRHLGIWNYSIGSRLVRDWGGWHNLNLYGHQIDLDNFPFTGHRGGLTHNEGQAVILLRNDGALSLLIDVGPNPEYGDRRYHEIFLTERDIAALGIPPL